MQNILDVVIYKLCNLIDHSDNYSQVSGSIFQFCKYGSDNNTTDSESFKFKSELLDKTNNEGIVNVKIAVPLKYLNNFWITLEMSLTNCEIKLILTWSANCVISEGNRVKTFAIKDTKLYVPPVTLSTKDNTKLLQQLKSGFIYTINWNKY